MIDKTPAAPDSPAHAASEPESDWHLDRPSERRSLLLCTLGALVGLGIAGAGLFTAHGTRIAGVPAEDVAIVNRVPLLISDFEMQLRSVYDVSLSQATAAQKHKVLDDMIREELYVQRGIELGLQNDIIEVRTALVGAVESQQDIDATAAQPSEADLTAYYAAHSAKYATEGTMLLGDYIAPDPSAAQSAVAALRAGQPLASVTQAFHLRSTGKVDDGQEFYFAAAIHLGERLFALARTLNDGAVSDPVTLPDGIHILVMQHNVRPVARAYAVVRGTVLDDWRSDAVARLRVSVDRFLRKRADVQIAGGFE